VILFGILLARLGVLLIHDSLSDPAHSEGLEVILGACCCALALILFFNLLIHPGDHSAFTTARAGIELRGIRY
jgi:hypothetical protein